MNRNGAAAGATIRPAIRVPIKVPRPESLLSRLFSARVLLSLLGVLSCWLLLAVLVLEGAGESQYFWQWYRVWPAFLLGDDGSFFSGPLWRGLLLTLLLSAVSMLFSLLLAALSAAMRLAGGPLARGLAIGYVQCARNIPLLVLVFFIYFVVAPWLEQGLGLGLGALGSAVIALSLFEGAYMSEILRAGVLSVPRGQWEAALSLGLPGWYAAGAVVVPQALRHVLPALLNQGVSLVKDSSLASVIAVAELTLQSRLAISSSFMSLEIWLITAVVYLVLCLLLGGLVSLLGRSLNRGWARAY